MIPYTNTQPFGGSIRRSVHPNYRHECYNGNNRNSVTVWLQYAAVARASQLHRRCPDLINCLIHPREESHMTITATTTSGTLDTVDATFQTDETELFAKIPPPKLLRGRERHDSVSRESIPESPSKKVFSYRHHSKDKAGIEPNNNIIQVDSPSSSHSQTGVVAVRWPNATEVEQADVQLNENDLWKTCSKSITAISCTKDTATLPNIQRVSTSTILGEQNDIWQKIQLERQTSMHRHVLYNTDRRSPWTKNNYLEHRSVLLHDQHSRHYSHRTNRDIQRLLAIEPITISTTPVSATIQPTDTSTTTSGMSNQKTATQHKSPSIDLSVNNNQDTPVSRCCTHNITKPGAVRVVNVLQSKTIITTDINNRPPKSPICNQTTSPQQQQSLHSLYPHNKKHHDPSGDGTATAGDVVVLLVHCIGCQVPIRLSQQSTSSSSSNNVLYCTHCGIMASRELLLDMAQMSSPPKDEASQQQYPND